MNDQLVTYGGWAVALIGTIIAALVQWRKGSVDETAMVLGKWKELVDSHQKSIEAMQNRIDSLTIENTELRSQLRGARTRLDEAEKRIRELLDEIAGLKRAIIQNSQAAGKVLRLGRDLEQDGYDEAAAKEV